nr:MAG TPA: hypothetical protein [Caudoviricetes sp.]
MSNEKCIIDPQRDCLGLQKADMLEKQITELRESARGTHKEMFDRIRELEKVEAARNEQYNNIMKKLDKLIEWQETEQQRPGRQWSDIKSKVVVAVLSSILTAAALAVLNLIVP